MLDAVTSNLKWITSPFAREAAVTDSRCDAILKQFRGTGECPADWPDDWERTGAPLVRRESTVYRLKSDQSDKTICIKIIHGGTRGSVNAGRLYDALRHYHPRSDRENGFTVPEPYGWIPEHAAVIMEWVEGRTFSETLKDDFLFTQRRHQNIRRAAGWLRWFHSQSPVEQGPLAGVRQIKGIARVFHQSDDLHPAATRHDPVLRAHLDLASSFSHGLRGTEVACADLHGDFKATNLLISRSGNVVGLDFLGGKRGPISHDICRFLCDLDFYRNWFGRSHALNPGARSNDFEAFHSAYGNGCAGGLAGQTFMQVYFLTILSALVHQRKKFRRGMIQRVRLVVLRSIARQLANKISPRPRAVMQPTRLAWRNLPWIPIEWGVVIWQSDLIWCLQ